MPERYVLFQYPEGGIMRQKFYSTLSITALLAFTTSPVLAQSSDVEQMPASQTLLADTDDVIVTATRLRQGDKSVPTLTITSEEIEARGITSIDQLLRQLPNNNSSISASNPGGINGPQPSNRGNFISNLAGGSVANLRGLGPGSTLVLVNGRRRAGEGGANGDFFDIAGIAINSIDRVEIVSSGASAIYGSDAVAGVINIILKDDYEGTTLNLRAENSSSGGDMQSIGLTHGRRWSGGGLTVTGNYVRNKAVSLREFGITTSDQRASGGNDFRRLSSANGVFFRNENIFGTPDRGDVFASTAFELPDGFGEVDDFTEFANFNQVSRDSLEEILPESLSPATELLNVSLNVNQDINLGVLESVSAEFNYSKRNTDTEVAGLSLDVSASDLAFGEFGSPFLDDDFFPREDISFVRALSREVAAGIVPENGFETNNEDFGLALGARGDFDGGWNWDISGSYSLNKDQSSQQGLDLISLYFGTIDDNTGDFISDPFNIVRADYLTNMEAQAALQSAITQTDIDSESATLSLVGVIRKDFLEARQVGAVSTAFGGEYRSETADSFRTELGGLSQTIDDVTTDSKRETLALFGEVSIPLNANLTVNGALRYEDVRNFGNTVTAEDALAAFIASDGLDQFDLAAPLAPYDFSDSGFSPRVGVSWEPIDTLTLRGTFGQSFRAPNAEEIAAPALAFGAFDFFDPVTEEPFDFLVPTIDGGNAELKSEVAQTLNFGFTFTPSFFGVDWDLTVDRWIIDYDDRITSASLFLGSLFSDPPEAANELVIVRSADGVPRYLIETIVNSAKEELAGVDISLSGSGELGEFLIFSDLKLALQTNRDEKATDEDPFIDQLGVNQPKTSWNWNTEISRGQFTFGGTVRYTGSFEQGFGSGFVVTQRNEVDSFATLDLQASYVFEGEKKLLNDTTIRLGVSNVFDEDPPFLNTALGFSSSFYNIRRRVISLGLSKEF